MRGRVGLGWLGDFNEKVNTGLFRRPLNIRSITCIMIGKYRENHNP